MNNATNVPAELWPLIDAALDGSITPQQADHLQSLLETNREACKVYGESARIEAELYLLVRGCAANQAVRERIGNLSKTDDRAPGVSPAIAPTFSPIPSFLGDAIHGTVTYFSQGMPFSYLVATVLVGLGLLIGSFIPVAPPSQVANNTAPSSAARQRELVPPLDLVGRITGMVDCHWADPNTAVPGPMGVPLGRKYALASGLMEITYDSGAKVILQGPAVYEVDSASGGFLSVGKLTARVAKRGERREERREGEKKDREGSQRTKYGVRSGDWTAAHSDVLRTPYSVLPAGPSPLSSLLSPLFAVRTPTAVVTDLGTEFGVEVTKEGYTVSHVFRGSVRVQMVGDGDPAGPGQVLYENESARVEQANSPGDGNVITVAGSTAKQSEFVRELPRCDERTTSNVSKRSNPIDSTPGLLYHLDAAHGVTVDKQGSVRVWSDQSSNGYDFVRAWTSKLVHVASEPSFNNRPVVRNATTNIPGLCLWRDTAPRSIIIVASTTDAGPAGGVWGHPFGGVRRANPNPDTGWVVDNATVDDFAYGGSFYINGVAGHLQEYNSPGIIEAYGPNPNIPVFEQTSLFGNSSIENGTRWWQGDIAEIIAFDRVLTQAERASIVGYLGAKYQIAPPFDASKSEQSSLSNEKTPSPPTRKEKTP